jgi:hypothetical protein
MERFFHKKPFTVKSAGGAASQCIALQNAIKVSNMTGRPFIFKHFPFSTGGYWPLAIEELLSQSEISADFGKTVGLSYKHGLDFMIGVPIPNHPLNRRGLSYEKILYFLKKARAYSAINFVKCFVRSEHDVRNSMARLESIPKNMKFLTGGFVPLDDDDVHRDLALRFQRSGLLSPYLEPSKENNSILIHYRLGDKRVNFQNPRLKSGGIIDPKCLVNMLPSPLGSDLLVVSDEPREAVNLLKSIGINGSTPTSGEDLWEDLKVMVDSRIMICSWSTVSQLAATIRSFQEKMTYYPSKDPGTGSISLWPLRFVKYYEPVFLAKHHEIYTHEIVHSVNTNSIYKKAAR